MGADQCSIRFFTKKDAMPGALSGERVAARVYENAIKLAPAEANLPPNLKSPLARARQVVEKTRAAAASWRAFSAAS